MVPAGRLVVAALAAIIAAAAIARRGAGQIDRRFCGHFNEERLGRHR
jgi:hypothetical protein